MCETMNNIKINRGLALLYAIGLGIGEALVNWGDWQYAPLWIVDYMIVSALLLGVFWQRFSQEILKGAWGFALGVMYMAMAVSTDPAKVEVYQTSGVILALISVLIVLSALGLWLSYQWPGNH